MEREGMEKEERKERKERPYYREFKEDSSGVCLRRSFYDLKLGENKYDTRADSAALYVFEGEERKGTKKRLDSCGAAFPCRHPDEAALREAAGVTCFRLVSVGLLMEL
ncbi:hypothetical protein EYF80_045402 [Liparis tanakae]|uniref:Uncharacterized protein n=1 Tax=Liparis tanakae TaxID=230148 RepID=A0A4Z2FTB9_9TELE|nr:hypothetical protein EYF80_045402 [Liparis tanakae]